jgi:hypothetical protein
MPHTSLKKGKWIPFAKGPSKKKEVLFKPKPDKEKRKERQMKFQQELDELEKRIVEEAPPRLVL